MSRRSSDALEHRRRRRVFAALFLLGPLAHAESARAQDTPPSDGPSEAPLPPAAPEPAPPPAQPEVVTIKGARTEAQQRQQSAEAVNVVDLHRSRQQTADLGEVLARTQGVAVRRDGGLGSQSHFALNGLYDDQIRFFLDGVPLDLAGYPFGIANVPVNLVERVEVYRGVVPIRLGADALGGAVNLVGNSNYDSRLSTSYQVGSFGTHRFTVDARYRHDESGFVAGVSGFFDTTKNNYDVDVETSDSRGRLGPATVKRFHDGYRARGVAVEVGVVDKPWATRLLVKGFASGYDKELQNNVVMTVPYGEATYGESVHGATARYEVALQRTVNLDVVASYAHRTIDFEDRSPWIYDWYGERIRARRVAGEVDTRPSDRTIWQNAVFSRAVLGWTPSPGHSVRASITPQFTTRTGDEHLLDPAVRDPLNARQNLFTLVSGLEYEASLFDDRLSNAVFVKDYLYSASAEETLPGDVVRNHDASKHGLGVGDGLRFRFSRWLLAKASYEFTRRLPRPDEVFGNGVLVLANLDLAPEVSHNVNLGPRVELRKTAIGDVVFDVNAFVRDSDRLIVLLGTDSFFTYQNVYRARNVGLENALSWTSPGRWLSLDGMLTWQDLRNASSEGPFADYDGDRIPNRPYLFGSWGARLRFQDVFDREDSLEPFYNGRYVHSFLRGWESQGLRQFKQSVDAQVTHNLGVSWTARRSPMRMTTTLEVDNVTDARVYDNFGVQRPGRAFYLKWAGDL